MSSVYPRNQSHTVLGDYYYGPSTAAYEYVNGTRVPHLIAKPFVPRAIRDEWWTRNVHQFNRFSCEYLAEIFKDVIPVDLVVHIYTYVGGTSDLYVFLQLRSDIDPWLVDLYAQSYDGGMSLADAISKLCLEEETKNPSAPTGSTEGIKYRLVDGVLVRADGGPPIDHPSYGPPQKIPLGMDGKPVPDVAAQRREQALAMLPTSEWRRLELGEKRPDDAKDSSDSE